MLPKSLRLLLPLCLLRALLCSDGTKALDDPPPQTSKTKGDSQADQQKRREQEEAIDQRDAEGNGIRVDPPKVYDDSLLQQMLNAAQARLMSLQILDQTGI